jgi:glutamine amidotransferase
MTRVGIIDLGIGNAVSVRNALYTLGYESVIFSDSRITQDFTHIILPGVGAFDRGIREIERLGFRQQLKNFQNEDKPILGICLGMQLLFEESEEGSEEGLGLLSGQITKIHPTTHLRIPNTGWHYVCTIKENQIRKDVSEFRAYHNHSFAYQDVSSDSAFLVLSGYQSVIVGVEVAKVIGLQFHPEKSHGAGLKLLKNFCDL